MNNQKFNFNIDDWTGGNTLGKSMGDAVASTVKEQLFSIITKNVNEFNFYNNGILPLIVDWGDGNKQNIVEAGRVSHKYEDSEMIPRHIKFYNQENTLKIDKDKQDTSLITISTDLDSYIIEPNIYVDAYRYLEMDFDNTVRNLVFRHLHLKTLHSHAFENLNVFSSIIIPNSVTRIDTNCFRWSSVKNNLILPDSLKVIGVDAFNEICIYGNLVLPKALTEIGPHAFRGLRLLNNLVIPNSVEKISFNAFGDLNTCTNIHFGKGLKYIDEYAFTYATDLKGPLKLNDGLEYIGDCAFSDISTLSGNLVIPASVKEIGIDAFTSCVSLQSIVFNEGLEKIGSRAFKDCDNLSTDIVVPESVKVIDYMAFDFFPYDYITIYICKDTKCNKLISEKGRYNVNITFYEKGDKPKIL